MIGRVFKIRKESDLLVALETILPVVEENAGELKINPEQFSDLADDVASYRTALNEWYIAQNAARAATKKKQMARHQARKSYMAWGAMWRTNLDLSDSLLARLMLSPHEIRQERLAATAPCDLIAVPAASGMVLLKWKPGDQRRKNVYQIEARLAGRDWKPLTITSKRRIRIQTQIGQPITFHVVSLRGKKRSTPSHPVTVWAESNCAA